MFHAPVAVVGLGHLGREIAAALACNGFEVLGTDPRAEAAEQTRAQIQLAAAELIAQAGFPASLREDAAQRFAFVARVEGLEGAAAALESAPEAMETKKAVLGELEAALAPDALIGSNTSAIPITELQRAARHPERIVGMHFGQPVHASRFLEIVRGEHTSDAYLERARRLGLALGKEPSLVQKDVDGFLVNRIAYAMYREALHLIEEGAADPATVDAAFRNVIGTWAGLYGPFRWMDLSGGPALYAATMERLLPTLARTTEVPELMQRMRREGGTFYSYDEGEWAEWQRHLREEAWRLRRLHESLPDRVAGPAEDASE
jgi:3-hydroxybutyryl-CoA dehydrogenase